MAEAEGRDEDAEQALADTLDILRETKAILIELIMVDAQGNPSAWLLRGSIVAAVEQVLDQLDLEERARLHARWREQQLARPLAQLPPLIEGVWIHPEHPLPRDSRVASPRSRRTQNRLTSRRSGSAMAGVRSAAPVSAR